MTKEETLKNTPTVDTTTKRTEKRTETHECDYISRQAAIDAAIEAADDWDGGFNIYRSNMIENAIKALPSAQQWIPVTERLPKKYIGEWLCCTDDGNIMILPYDTPGDGSKECVFYYREDDYTVVKPNVVAWMPLPEPYKGGET